MNILVHILNFVSLPATTGLRQLISSYMLGSCPHQEWDSHYLSLFTLVQAMAPPIFIAKHSCYLYYMSKAQEVNT